MKQKKYFNRGQIEAMIVSAKNEFVVASRGFGKSEGIDAPRLLRNVFAMPGSNGILLSNTYSKLLQNTLPAVFTALSRLGYRRDVHYVIGKRPPKNMGFKKPIYEVLDYSHVVSWANGSTQTLISFDRPMSVNSMSVDYIMGFEAKYLNYEKIVQEVMPALRGKRQYFKNIPWHHGMVFTTDMPTLKSGMWILDKEKDMDTELITGIKLTYKQIQEHKAKKKMLSEPYYSNRLRKLTNQLAFLRSRATFYAEYNVFDNLEILGEKFIREQKRNLPDFLFSTSILNQRPRKVPNAYYSALKDSIHYYDASNHSFLEGIGYPSDYLKAESRHYADYLPDRPLAIACDYNSAINNLVVGQVDDRKLLTQRLFYVKTPRKLPDLVHEFCDFYSSVRNKQVVFYYDSTAVHTNAISKETFAETVMAVLRKRGWRVSGVAIGNPMRHVSRHPMIHKGMTGDGDYMFPMFNKEGCELLLTAMEQTGIKRTGSGFEKDKDLEKLPDSLEHPDELKTHSTDAWDTLYIGIHKRAPGIVSSGIGGGSTIVG